MRKIINKYQTLPFYASNTSEAKAYPLNSPANRLVPFVLPFDTVTTSHAWRLISADGATVYNLDNSLIEKEVSTGGKTYLIYKGGTLNISPVPGEYQVEFTVDGARYWSHTLCLSERFESLDISLSVSCATELAPPVVQPPEAFYFTLSFDSPTTGARYIEAAIDGGAYARLTDNKFDWNSFSDLSGEKTVYLKAFVVVGDVQIWKEYTFVFDAEDACNTYELTEIDGGSTFGDRYAYLEFWNTKDMKDRELIYQTGFKQRIYFEAHYDFPIPAIERNFRQNGKNENILASSATAERLPVDFHPVPDAVLLALSSVADHDNYRIGFTADGSTQQLSAIEFERRAAENDEVSIGRLTIEYDRTFVACAENEDLI